MRLFLVIAVGLIAARPGSAQDQKPDYSTPQKTYETYLRAILAKDLKGAVACHHLVGEGASEVLDVAVGTWVVAHELRETARLKFGANGVAILQEWNDSLFRPDCSKAAIERTLKRVGTGKVKIDGDTESLSVRWAEEEPLEKPVFHYSGGGAIETFRKVGAEWKIDVHAQAGLKRPSDFFEKGTWGPMFREALRIERAVLPDLRSGKLRTEEETIAAFEKRLAEVNDKYNPGWREQDATAKAAASIKCPSATHLPTAKTTISSTHVPIVAVSDSGVVYAIWISFGDDKAPTALPPLPKALEFGEEAKSRLAACAPGIHVFADGKWGEPGRLLFGQQQASPAFAWCEGEVLHLLVCDEVKSHTHHVAFDPEKKSWSIKARLPHYFSSPYGAFRVVGKSVHVAFSEGGAFWYLTYDGERWSKALRLEQEGRVVSGGRMAHLAVTDQGVAHVAWWAMVDKPGRKETEKVHRRAVVRDGKVEYHDLRFEDAPIDAAEFDIGVDREGRLIIAYQAKLPEKHADANKIHIRRLVAGRWTEAVKIDGHGERLAGDIIIVGNKSRTLITWSQTETYPFGGGVLGTTFRRLSVDDGKGWSPPRWVARNPSLRGNGTPVSIIWAGVCLDKAGRVHMVWSCCSYCMVEDLSRPVAGRSGK